MGAAILAGTALAGNAVAVFVVNLAISYAVSAIMGRFNRPNQNLPDAQSRQYMVRSAVEARRIIYGQVVTSGPLVFASSTNVTKDVSWTQRSNIPSSSPYTISVPEYVSDLGVYDDSGSEYSGNYFTGGYSVSPNGTYTFSSSAAGAPVGITYTRRKTEVANGYLHMVVCLAGHECESIDAVYLDDEAVGTLDGSGNVTTGRFAGFVRVKKHLGASDQAADSDLVSEVSEWTTDHRLRGICYVYVRLKWDADVFPNGMPNIKALVSGKKVYDPRTSTTSYSDNWALCVRDYLTSSYGLNTSNVDSTACNAAANICDESVSTPVGTQSRYTCNGTFKLDQKPSDIMEGLVSAAAGTTVWTQGTYRILAGAYSSPVLTIGEDDIRGQIKIRPRLSRKSLFNAVRGTFSNPDKSYQQTDFPPVENSTYETQDGGEQIFRDITLDYTNDVYAAQRIAKIHLERSRQGITVEVPCKYTAFKVNVWDTVQVTNHRLGWSSKVFRVIDWTHPPEGGVDLVLQEEASAVYDWNSGNATTVDPAPDTNLPSAFTVAQPGAPEVTEALYATTDGSGVKTKAIVQWQPATDAFVTTYQLEYKLATSSTWKVLPGIRDYEQEVLDLEPGKYNWRVKSVNSLGISSAYSSSTKEIYGLLTPPTEPQNLTISSIGGLAILRWTPSIELDVRIGGKYIFRHSNAQTGAVWTESVSIGDAIDGSVSVAVLPLKPGTYLVKTVDSGGRYSSSAASVSTAGATSLAYSNVDTVTESTTFPGTHDGTVSTGGVLKLDSAGDIDSWSDVDSVSDWDSEGGINRTGTYTFSGGIDLTTVQRVRLITTISATVVNAKDLIDDRGENIDDWEDFDGDSAGDTVDAQVWVRFTDSDPTSSPEPSWSSWQRLEVSEFNTRAFQFQCRLSSSDPAYNIEIDTLTVDAEGL